MSLRILRKFSKSCIHIQEHCLNTQQRITWFCKLHSACVPSSFTPSSTNSLSNWQSRHGVEVHLAGVYHYCSLPPDHHHPGTLQQLLEESTDPNVMDGKDLVYWEPAPHLTNPLYKSPEQEAEEQAQRKPNPQFACIILFPGSFQGSQGLINHKGLQLPNVQQMYSTASEILGFDLLKTSLQGSRNELSRMQIQQPAVLVASLAAIERLRKERPGALELCSSTAGYGVGEITALTFAGALSFEDAVHLVKVRAEAMQLTAELTSSGAARIHCVAGCRLALVLAAAVEHCKRSGVEDPHCSVSACLHSSCKVVAGSNEALLFLETHSEKLQLKRVQRLSDSGAFHTDLMRPAAEVIAQALKQIPIRKPFVRVLSTADGRQYQCPDDIRRDLPRHVRRPLLWQQTLAHIYERKKGQHYPTTYVCGPSDGQMLTKLLHINNERAAANIHVVTA